MTEVIADEFVAFPGVRVIRSTATAVFCTIGDKSIWLPRGHIRGKPSRKGDRGTLLVRYRIALDRDLVSAPDPLRTDAAPTAPLSALREEDCAPQAEGQERSPRGY